jgi:hypothetical protein
MQGDVSGQVLTLVISMCIWTNKCESNAIQHIILLLLKYIHTIKALMVCMYFNNNKMMY